LIYTTPDEYIEMKVYPDKGTYHFTNLGSQFGYCNSYDETVVITNSRIDQSIFTIPKEREIISQDKVLVSKFSSFPSLLLSRIEKIDITRSVNPDKASKIVVDQPEDCRIGLTDMFYGVFFSSKPELPPIRMIMADPAYFSHNFLVSSSCSDFPDEGLSSYEPEGVAEPCITINERYELCNYILNYTDKLVLSERLVEYTNNYLPSLDDESYASFASMLSSPDPNILKVCINTLATFNLGNYTTLLSLEIKKNYANLIKLKITGLGSFNRIISLCGISKSDILYGSRLDFYEKLYEEATDDENRRMIRNFTQAHIMEDTNDRYYNYLSKMGLKVTIQ
jgi:hypothetical protein